MSKSIKEVFQINNSASIKELTDKQYANDFLIWAHATQQRARMVPLAVHHAMKKLYSLTSIRILSVGCGAGLFDIPFLEALSQSFSQIEFVGVDPNKTLLDEFSKQLSVLQKKAPNISSKLKLGVLEDIDKKEEFNLINLTQVLYYIDDIKSFLNEILLHLSKNQYGIIQLFHSPKDLINQIFETAQTICLNKNEPTLFSDDVHSILKDVINLHYSIDRIRVTYSDDTSEDPWVDITPISSLPLSSEAQSLLNFMIGMQYTSLPNENQQQLRNFLLNQVDKLGRKYKGHLYLPRPVDFFQISKIPKI